MRHDERIPNRDVFFILIVMASSAVLFVIDQTYGFDVRGNGKQQLQAMLSVLGLVIFLSIIRYLMWRTWPDPPKEVKKDPPEPSSET